MADIARYFSLCQLRFDKLLNDRTEMDENLNIAIPKTNLAAIYKLTDGYLTPSPVKNHSLAQSSGRRKCTASNNSNQDR